MIDPLTSTIFSIHNAKGVYALLLGSGISRAAQIPTGWEVTLDLIKRIASIAGESDECEANPETWYRARFHQEPDYSRLLEEIATSPAERTALLSRYFEADSTRDDDFRKPSKAHLAIAKMVKRGYFRVIVTTNFDRLLEQALEIEGVSPSIISTPDAIVGALPLVHAGCTLIKLHGDYRDARLRNTAAELEKYDPITKQLLDKVLDEYGLIISGWSATWDTALRQAIAGAPNRRFTTVWTYLSRLSPEAQELVMFRQAREIKIVSADTFFCDLNERLISLEKFDAPHPISVELAVSAAKRFLSEERYRIDLYDLIANEVNLATAPITDLPLQVGLTRDLYINRMKQYEVSFERLAAILLTIAYWGDSASEDVIIASIEKLMTLKSRFAGLTVLIDLQMYPAILMFYAVGLAFVSAGRYKSLAKLLRNFRTGAGELNQVDDLAFTRLQLNWCVNKDLLNQQSGRADHLPASDRVFAMYLPLFNHYLPSVINVEDLFDRFEYLCALVYADQNEGSQKRSPCGSWGRWAWRNRHWNNHVSQKLKAERDREGEDWPPLKEGLFVSAERFDEVFLLHQTECLSKLSTW